MIKTVVLPFGKGGIIGGSMLGLGRALGETIAVTLIISPIFDPHALTHVLQTGGNSIASLIALRFSESNEFGISALMAAGLTLFVITLIVNAFASVIVSRVHAPARRRRSEVMRHATDAARETERREHRSRSGSGRQGIPDRRRARPRRRGVRLVLPRVLLYERLTPLSGGLGFFVTLVRALPHHDVVPRPQPARRLEARDQLARSWSGPSRIGC